MKTKYVDNYEQLDFELKNGMGVCKKLSKEFLRKIKMFEVENFYSTDSYEQTDFYGKLTRSTLFLLGKPILEVRMRDARYYSEGISTSVPLSMKTNT